MMTSYGFVMKLAFAVVLVIATRLEKVYSQDACDTIPCENQGMCIGVDNDRYTCMCRPQWKGTNCEIDYDECSSPVEVCQNGGSCLNAPGTFSCICPVGYSGTNCQTDACHDQPCQNQGTCSMDSHNPSGYTCMCSADFTGDRCEIDIGDQACPVNVCQNGGTCIQISSQDLCYCLPAFTGQHCELLQGCSSDPCLNGGECNTSVTDPNGYVCDCSVGYTGRVCQTVLEAQCIFDGELYSTEEIRINQCNKCWCRNGLWFCTNKYCGEIHIGFSFQADFSLIENRIPEFQKSLTQDLSRTFSIAETMFNNFFIIEGSIQIEFSLVSSIHSQVNIEDVALHMQSQFESSAYAFVFDDITMNTIPTSVKVTKDSETPVANESSDSGGITMETIVIVCIVIGASLMLAVVIGSSLILVYRQKSESTNLGSFEVETGSPSKNNINPPTPKKVNYHNNLYREAKSGACSDDSDSVEEFKLHQ